MHVDLHSIRKPHKLSPPAPPPQHTHNTMAIFVVGESLFFQVRATFIFSPSTDILQAGSIAHSADTHKKKTLPPSINPHLITSAIASICPWYIK